MQIKVLTTYSLFCLSLIVNSACKKDSDENPDTRKSMAVEELTVHADNIDLVQRSNWKLVLQRSYYTYKADGAMLSAKPESTPHLFYIGEGALTPLLPEEEPGIFFMSAGYIDGLETLIVKDAPPKFPNIKNQSTLATLLEADLLHGKYAGLPSKNLSNVLLVHANALLDFDLQGLPDDAVVKILDTGKPFSPFQDKENHYQAIVTGKWVEHAQSSISVETGGKTYTVLLLDREHLKGNTRYTFTVRFDAVNQQLLIENLTPATWTATKWPGM